MSKTTETGWVYIIDPKERILQHKKIPMDFTEMKKIMGCDMGEIVQLGHGLVMVCDENARLQGEEFRSHFRWNFRRNEDGSMSPNRYLESDTRPMEDIVFCNKCILLSTIYDDDDMAQWSSAMLQLWQVGECLDWLHESYHDEPSFEIHMFDDENITKH